MKRAEVEKNIKASKFVCRGKRIFSDKQIAEFRQRFAALVTLKQMVVFKEWLEHELAVGIQFVQTTEQAHARVSSLIYAYPDTVGRPMCGQDVGELILAGKLDGLAKAVQCPKCGETLEYIPAIAEEDVN